METVKTVYAENKNKSTDKYPRQVEQSGEKTVSRTAAKGHDSL